MGKRGLAKPDPVKEALVDHLRSLSFGDLVAWADNRLKEAHPSELMRLAQRSLRYQNHKRQGYG